VSEWYRRKLSIRRFWHDLASEWRAANEKVRQVVK
jgi:hypothetical protein